MFAFAFVFPGEAAALPYIDETEITLGPFGGGAHYFDVLFEAIVFAGGVGLGGGGLAEQAAEVDEMLLACGTFGKLCRGPFFDECFGGVPTLGLVHRMLFCVVGLVLQLEAMNFIRIVRMACGRSVCQMIPSDGIIGV